MADTDYLTNTKSKKENNRESVNRSNSAPLFGEAAVRSSSEVTRLWRAVLRALTGVRQA